MNDYWICCDGKEMRMSSPAILFSQMKRTDLHTRRILPCIVETFFALNNQRRPKFEEKKLDGTFALKKSCCSLFRFVPVILDDEDVPFLSVKSFFFVFHANFVRGHERRQTLHMPREFPSKVEAKIANFSSPPLSAT